METTRKLAELIVRSGYRDISPDAVNKAKLLILDFAGGALIGNQTKVGKIITEYVKDSGGNGEVGVIGTGFKTSAAQAAYANCTLDHACEVEALGGRIAFANPSACIGTSLAMGEKLGLSGVETLEALIVGFEFQGRVTHGVIDGLHKRWTPVTTLFLGATAVACKAMRLDVETTRTAFGVCAPQISGLPMQVGVMTHYLELSYGARVGIEAAILASKGLTANTSILEMPQGYADAFFDKGDPNLEEMTKDWGNPYLAASASIKKYPCCYAAHRALDEVLDIMREQKIGYADINEVKVDMNEWAANFLRIGEPKNEPESRFSLSHMLGSAILKGTVPLDAFTDSAVAAPEFKEARGKVTVTVRHDWPASRSAIRLPVRIKLVDGREFSKEVERPREPSEAEVLEMYRSRTQPFMKKADADRLQETILNLEKLDNVAKVMAVLTNTKVRGVL